MKQWARKWTVSIICCIVIVVTAAISIWQWTGDSSDGTVKVDKPTTPAAEKPMNTTPVSLDTSYFSATLPTGFTVKRQSETPDKVVQLEMVANSKTQQFAVTVGTLPAEGLAGLGTYNLRVKQKATYTAYNPAGMPVAATGFRSVSDPAALTFYWPHGSKYAEIALSSDSGATYGQLFATFEQASHSWQWK